ncbi:hypothetical protein ACJX0J_012498, partial [Zea mays]
VLNNKITHLRDPLVWLLQSFPLAASFQPQVQQGAHLFLSLLKNSLIPEAGVDGSLNYIFNILSQTIPSPMY